ncbi:MAG: CRISPR-associated protein Cas5 [Candidatus Aenigmatarchaeota archaeon]
MQLLLKIETISFSYRNPLFLTSFPSLFLPPPTSIYGLLAALIGKGNNDVKENRKIIRKEIQEKIKKLEIYLPDVKTDRFEFGILRWNADKNKWKKSWSTVVTQSYIFNFTFFVRLNCDDSLGKTLKEKIKRSESIFTPYLGSSENLIKSISLVDEKEIDLSSFYKLKEIEEVKVKEGEIITLLQLPSGYDENGTWQMKKFVIIK